jgi:hypothetical protein
MARPKIGIFGALVAVGGLLAWRWAQKHRASQANLNRELSRWEDEGGAVASTAQAAGRLRPRRMVRAIRTGSARRGLFHIVEPCRRDRLGRA